MRFFLVRKFSKDSIVEKISISTLSYCYHRFNCSLLLLKSLRMNRVMRLQMPLKCCRCVGTFLFSIQFGADSATIPC